ncbi:Lrp/AsnC family transcriptional regulator [Bradyrhizobium sacchari]|uniref:AsnC family transcriptional regulator n=1 Tax=Bradyrhizobium sacchari TaxID=1399419 RepID=A0A560IIQ9_9BRAD|nr:Lrp/AsnC family transcriptional regulator [Bradyrhizobium sacchari]TWB56984.1 AsnC family transcriptional regulator [Bradyrhizobium sacchari]TWB71261.1 AsnC family transcriptional regulator [Bradyrhizobium sacchari]
MSFDTLDKIDLRILQELQNDASLTNVELASRVHLSPSPCLARVKNLERLGVINRRVAVVDPQMVGLRVMAFIQVTLEKHVQSVRDGFATEVGHIAEIMDCYLMVGDQDYLLRAIVSDVSDLENLIARVSRIVGVASIRSGLAVRNVSSRRALPLDVSRPIQVKSASTDSGRHRPPLHRHLQALA